MSVCTRFAPSPTGYLHIGGVRTALYSWLYARRHNGKFILRIEDTDEERSTEESVAAILEGMKWLGIDYDEGPSYQSQRLERYQQVAAELLNADHAYRCDCSKERLEELREQQIAAGLKPRYDGRCRDRHDIAADASHVLRLKTPQTGTVSFNDAVRGQVVIENAELDDLILMRSDGTPTYNFSVVIDDGEMGVNYVIRGEDHVSNTPRQINIMHALGFSIPNYAHVPMILAADGSRLSKRHGAASVLDYREQGFLPEALLNYLVRLGWSHGDQEIFSKEEMVQSFDLEHVSKSPASLNPDKLLWLNQHYIKTAEVPRLAELLDYQLKLQGIDSRSGPDLARVSLIQRERCQTMQEMADKSRFFYIDQIDYDSEAVAKHLVPELVPALEAFVSKLQQLSITDWEYGAIKRAMKEVLAEFGLGMAKLAQPVRVALTGNTSSPSIDVTLELVGKDRAISRLQTAIEMLA